MKYRKAWANDTNYMKRIGQTTIAICTRSCMLLRGGAYEEIDLPVRFCGWSCGTEYGTFLGQLLWRF
jgi:hypothetical protein